MFCLYMSDSITWRFMVDCLRFSFSIAEKEKMYFILILLLLLVVIAVAAVVEMCIKFDSIDAYFFINNISTKDISIR
jgi:hypothetical protein